MNLESKAATLAEAMMLNVPEGTTYGMLSRALELIQSQAQAFYAEQDDAKAVAK